MRELLKGVVLGYLIVSACKKAYERGRESALKDNKKGEEHSGEHYIVIKKGS